MLRPQGTQGFPEKKISPFGPAVWPAIWNIYTNILFYYMNLQLTVIEHKLFLPKIACIPYNYYEAQC